MNVTGSVWSSRVDSISVGSSSSSSSSSAAATERAASKNSVQRTLIVNANGSMGIGMAVIEVLAVAEVLLIRLNIKFMARSCMRDVEIYCLQ